MSYQPPAIYGIIGYPLTHSLSPLMHNAAFKALKVNAVYKLFELKDDEELKLFFEDLKQEGNPILGLNVTVPYKEKVLAYVDSLDPFAEKAGAVNTLAITHQRKIHGFNTDGPGFLSHLEELNFSLKGKRIAMLGAGGTARAILSVLCLVNQRPAGIKLYNRTLSKARNLVEELAQKMDTSIVAVVDSVEDLNVELADCLINTTSVGLKAEAKPLVDPGHFHADMLVYDVIYNPAQTDLLKAAKAKGAKTSNGLGMLYYQAVLALNHWSGVDIDDKYKKVMRQTLESSLK
ncbi:MAG: shikimate dehydrogenase [Candidatus Omnitrophica bacterium]|nr:shikimate dehydrogenase [Candidatus Omnitrophota bacterium]